jgi:hypothetical protein
MKHIRQSSKKHTTGSFNVTKNMPSFTPAKYLGTESNFPFYNITEKLIAVCRCTDPGDLKEDISQPPAVDSPGRYAAPGQALPLYMDQTALHNNIRPELSNDSNYIGIAVHVKASRVQSSLFQTFKEFQKFRFGILRHTILSSYKHVCLGFHQSNKAMRSMQKCPIQDKVPTLLQVPRWCRRHLCQTIIDHTIKLPWAKTALGCQLPDRITFNNPESKQLLFFGTNGLITPSSPTIRVPTRSTEPTLFPFSTMTISPEYFCTERTPFFSS